MAGSVNGSAPPGAAALTACGCSPLGQHLCLRHPEGRVCRDQVSTSSENLLMTSMSPECPTGGSSLENPSPFLVLLPFTGFLFAP